HLFLDKGENRQAPAEADRTHLEKEGTEVPQSTGELAGAPGRAEPGKRGLRVALGGDQHRRREGGEQARTARVVHRDAGARGGATRGAAPAGRPRPPTGGRPPRAR